MDDLEGRISSILSSPEDMARIMSLARSLGGTGVGFDGGEKAPEPEQQTKSEPTLDPHLLRLLASALNSDSNGDALISALEPYLKKERRDRLAQAMKLTRLAHIVRQFMSERGESGE